MTINSKSVWNVCSTPTYWQKTNSNIKKNVMPNIYVPFCQIRTFFTEHEMTRRDRRHGLIWTWSISACASRICWSRCFPYIILSPQNLVNRNKYILRVRQGCTLCKILYRYKNRNRNGKGIQIKEQYKQEKQLGKGKILLKTPFFGRGMIGITINYMPLGMGMASRTRVGQTQPFCVF